MACWHFILHDYMFVQKISNLRVIFKSFCKMFFLLAEHGYRSQDQYLCGFSYSLCTLVGSATERYNDSVCTKVLSSFSIYFLNCVRVIESLCKSIIQLFGTLSISHIGGLRCSSCNIR